MSLECLVNREHPLCLPIVTFARWGPGRHHAGTATRSVHRVQSERAQCVLPRDEYKGCLGDLTPRPSSSVRRPWRLSASVAARTHHDRLSLTRHLGHVL